MRRYPLVVVAGLLLAACWPFKGKSDPVAPPVLANSPRTIDSLWQIGQQAFNSGHWGDARKIFNRIGTAMTPGDLRFSRLRFFQGEIELAQGNDLDAVRIFRRIADETPRDSLAPDALLRAADAYAGLWRRPELDPTYGLTAQGVYQEVQTRYPGTVAAARAQLGLRELEEDFAFKSYRNALFYFKYKAWDSAILALRALIAQFPRTAVVPEALEKLVASYQHVGYTEDVRETCEYIARFHPNPEGPIRLCPAAAPAAVDSAPGGSR